MSDSETSGRYRDLVNTLKCVILGHRVRSDLTWKVTNDSTHRAAWGDLCLRCSKFQPRENGKDQYRDTDK